LLLLLLLPPLLLPLFLSVPQVFACVVGQRPSKAKFYVNDTNEVVELLAKLAGVGLPPRNVSF
jgi:trehalose 6-phosphate synthase/phosphatase